MSDTNRVINTSHKIVKVRKNDDGVITDIMLENDNVLPINQVILMAKHGNIEGFTVVRGKNGGEFLRADSNDTVDDSIDNYPTFR